MLAGRADAQPAPQQPLPVLDVPFISQSEALCGGAAAAMVLRYWGERGLTAESFAHLVDRSAAGIRTTALVADLQQRGWNATGIEGTRDLMARELARGRPVLTLIEDRPGTFHYVVVVAATPGGIVFHDPARAPFRVMDREDFDRRWDAADRWMAVVVPGPRAGEAGAGDSVTPPAAPSASAETTCDRLVADGVRLAQGNDLDGAERMLGAPLTCPGPAAVRELAGLRLLQRRWPEVEELASAAVAADPADTYAWRLLATSRFVSNEPAAALDAWNRAGEPRLDLITFGGLGRTRQRVVEELMALTPGDLLTVERFARAERRLQDLPSAAAARLEYVPVPGGLAELRASVLERPLVPAGWWSYAAIGLEAAARQEVDLTLGSFTGGGERVDLSWRFWPNRPRLAAAIEAPAPWGGLWAVRASGDRQPFDAAFPAAERLTLRVAAADWLTSRVHVGIDGGSDRWRDRGSFGMAGARARIVTRDGLFDGAADAAVWVGSSTFSSVGLSTLIRSSSVRRGLVALGRAGASVTANGTPPDLWFAGDVGHARPVLLRGHPLVDDGAVRTERLGRAIVYGTFEAQQWWRAPAGAAVGAAVFADAARVWRRLGPAALGDVDAGIGARLALPGMTGVFRVDLARGLRDGRTALSFAYEP